MIDFIYFHKKAPVIMEILRLLLKKRLTACFSRKPSRPPLKRDLFQRHLDRPIRADTPAFVAILADEFRHDYPSVLDPYR
jgi:hypothetical protein